MCRTAAPRSGRSPSAAGHHRSAWRRTCRDDRTTLPAAPTSHCRGPSGARPPLARSPCGACAAPSAAAPAPHPSASCAARLVPSCSR
eukprot:scaffold108119_cov96-Phaeocystis_antarctica.AAC.1